VSSSAFLKIAVISSLVMSSSSLEGVSTMKVASSCSLTSSTMVIYSIGYTFSIVSITGTTI
jgi:hypothetical protein